jgi:hypothetical protein
MGVRLSGGGGSRVVLSAGPGKKPFRPCRGTLARADGTTVPPGCSRPKHQNSYSTGRSSGFRLVTVPERPSRAWPVAAQWSTLGSGSLADYSGGPATDSHRFPFCPGAEIGAGGPVETLRETCSPEGGNGQSVPGRGRALLRKVVRRSAAVRDVLDHHRAPPSALSSTAAERRTTLHCGRLRPAPAGSNCPLPTALQPNTRSL